MGIHFRTVGAAFLTCLIAVAVFIYFLYPTHDEQKIRTTLLQTNADFAGAESLIDEGKYPEAIVLLERVAQSGISGRERHLVEVTLGETLMMGGGVADGVQKLKTIAADPAHTPKERAQALEIIAWQYHKTRDPDITPALSSTEPYREIFTKAENERDAYNLIFEYAASLYPLPVSSYRTAQMYAEKLLDISRKSGMNADKSLIDDYKNKIEENVRRAEDELERYPALYKKDRSDVLLRKAELASALYRAGYAITVDPEILYQEALSVGSGRKNASGFVILHYAIFLASTEPEKRHDEIVALLARFYASNEFDGSNVFTFFRNIREAPEVDNKGVLRLTKVDSKFKDFLVTKFGWSL